MKKKSKALGIIAFCIIGILFFGYIKYNTYHSSQLTISEVTDIEEFLIGHNISSSYVNDIQYYILSNTSVLIVDDRNAGCRLYIHSIINADMDTDGTLKVVVTDKAAISETDISGKYAVVIESQDKINTVKIEKEE